MSELRDLYQEIILDHNRAPRNFRAIEDATHTVEGYNPLCGDHYTVYLKVADGVVADVSFQGSGCAISKASASVMSSMVKGKTLQETEFLFERFHELLTGSGHLGETELESLGKLAAFAGVREYPMRVKCATLPWHTLHDALKGTGTTATTE